MSVARDTTLHTIGEIARTLGSSRLRGERLDAALALAADALRSEAVFLFMRRVSADGTDVLERLGTAGPSGRDAPAPLADTAADLLREYLERLEAGEIVTLADRPSSGALRGLRLVPLSLGGRLFGFLASAEKKGRRRLHGDMLRAVGAVFELWIARLDAEKRLNDFVDFIPTHTMVMDTRGVVTKWNRASEEMTGWKAEQVEGVPGCVHAIPFYGEARPTMPNLMLHPDKKWEAHYLEITRVGNTTYSMSYCPTVPGGGAFVRSKTSMALDLAGRLCAMFHTLRDVTRERQIEQNLQRSESMYRTIADFAGMGIMLLTKDEVLYHNDQLLKLMGRPAGPIGLPDLMEWPQPEDRTKVMLHFRDLFERVKEQVSFEFSAQHGSDTRYYSCHARALEYEDRPTVHFIADDITEQRELARRARMNELKMYHDDRLTALGTMAAAIAHELNQPLSTIRVVTDGLLFGKERGWPLEEDELFESLEMVSRQVGRMAGVIQNIRDFAREDRRQSTENVNVNEAVSNVFSMIGRQLEVHGVETRLILGSDLPFLHGSLNRLEQVIMNLVVNARQALDECGHDAKELRVETFARDSRVRIEVADNATGIPKEFLKFIFDPFFTTKEIGKGTGLGLTISQSIVAEFHGQIEAFNNQGGGATFLISMPVEEQA